MLVRLLMSHELNTIIYNNPSDQASNKGKKLMSSMRKGQYSLIVINKMP